MSSPGAFVFRFYGPIALSISLASIVAFSPTLIPAPSHLELLAGVHVGIVGIKIPFATWFENAWFIRSILVFLAAASLVFAVTVDFSRYFPVELRMDVYFDIRGIERTLALFTEENDREGFLAERWPSLIQKYDQEVIASLGSVWRQGPQGVLGSEEYLRELLHATGDTTFKVKRIGWLVYKIVESHGRLEYHFDVPKKPGLNFRGEFYLRDTAANHIRPSVRDVLRALAVILRPEFKQVFSVQERGPDAPFDHIVVGMTKVQLLPIPSLSNTLYLWKPSSGGAVPIAYCVYY